MRKTGETYVTARRQVLGAIAAPPPIDPLLRWHFPGNVPAATALRVLLAHAGIRHPTTGEPFSEAMCFGIAGGIGAGMFSFVYEAADMATFFLAGRHLWQDDLAYLKNACARLGITPEVRESGGARLADKQLADMLADGPCIAWVDMAHLPHRAMPAWCSGGGYHVITIYKIDGDHALIGDLADEPIPTPRADLATARGRIKKQKNRLLSISAPKKVPELIHVVRDGLRTCRDGLTGVNAKMKNFTLDAFRVWAERMKPGSKDKESWARLFTPGKRLLTALSSMYTCIDHYGTGGGLCRPIFADFLREAGEALRKPELQSLAEQYSELGAGWSELAEAALPNSVPALAQMKTVHAQKVELTHRNDADSATAVRACWSQLGAMEREAFPLNAAECADLVADLHARLERLNDGERTACAALGEVCAKF